jgi:diguanylate cyclase
MRLHISKKEEFYLVKDLLVNMAFVTSFISLESQLLKNTELNDSLSVWWKVTIGIMNGLLGITLMIFGVQINQTTIIDLRNVTIVMSAIHGGTISVMISGVMIALFRIFYYGVSKSSIFGIITIIIIAIGCGIIAKLRIKVYLKWAYCTLFNLIISSVAITILVIGKVSLAPLFSVYWITTCAISIIVYKYAQYCRAANSLFLRLKKESTKDFLTGLNNVRYFDTIYNNIIKNTREKNESLSLLMIDIDFFKKINDTYGHVEGDIVLKKLSKVLSESARSFDVISRNGGEEFTILLLDCSKIHAEQIAERIRMNVESYPFILSSGIQISVTVSIGVASYPDVTNELEKLLEKADIALYIAKRSGKNKISYGTCPM